MVATSRAEAETMAKGSTLWGAIQALRKVENLLELEAADPRIGALHRQARDLHKAIAQTIVLVAADAVDRSDRDRDCRECLTSIEHCEAAASIAGGRCCSECSHVG